MKRLLGIYFLLLSALLASCGNDSKDISQSRLKCEEKSTKKSWKGEDILVKKCQMENNSISLALNSEGDTVYLAYKLSEDISKVLYYSNNEIEKITIKVNHAGNRDVVNQEFKKIDDASFKDVSMLETTASGQGVHLHLNKEQTVSPFTVDSAIFIGVHNSYLSIFDADKVYKKMHRHSFFNDHFTLSKKQLENGHAIFLVFFSEEGREGFGVAPFYMDSVLALQNEQQLNSGNEIYPKRS